MDIVTRTKLAQNRFGFPGFLVSEFFPAFLLS